MFINVQDSSQDTAALIADADALTKTSNHYLTNQALTRQEYDNRSEFSVIIQRLRYHLTLAKTVWAEQERLVALLAERGLESLTELPGSA